MDKDIEILVLKYLDKVLTPEEEKLIKQYQDTPEWKKLISEYSQIYSDIEKTAFINKVKVNLSANKSNLLKHKTTYFIITLAAIIVIGYIVFDFNKDENQLASKKKDSYVNEEGGENYDVEKENNANTSVNDDAKSYEETVNEVSENSKMIESDQDIINNLSIHVFLEKNKNFSEIQKSTSDIETGIINVIISFNSPDSVLIFSKTINGIEYEKHLSFIGQYTEFNFYNLITINTDSKNAMYSILVFDSTENYIGRFIVNTIDNLPLYIEEDKFIFNYINNEGKLVYNSVDISIKTKCLTFKNGETSCISRY